jgi:Domain of unknown function (DUF4113)
MVEHSALELPNYRELLNTWFDRDTIFFGAQGIAREWQMRRTMLSP